MLILGGFLGLLTTDTLSFFGSSGWGIELDYCDVECKQTEIILFLRLRPSTAFLTLVDYEGYSISSMEFLPTVVDKMVI